MLVNFPFWRKVLCSVCTSEDVDIFNMNKNICTWREHLFKVHSKNVLKVPAKIQLLSTLQNILYPYTEGDIYCIFSTYINLKLLHWHFIFSKANLYPVIEYEMMSKKRWEIKIAKSFIFLKWIHITLNLYVLGMRLKYNFVLIIFEGHDDISSW